MEVEGVGAGAFTDLFAPPPIFRPVDAPHTWYAAMDTKSCELTVLGQHSRKASAPRPAGPPAHPASKTQPANILITHEKLSATTTALIAREGPLPNRSRDISACNPKSSPRPVAPGRKASEGAFQRKTEGTDRITQRASVARPERTTRLRSGNPLCSRAFHGYICCGRPSTAGHSTGGGPPVPEPARPPAQQAAASAMNRSRI